MFKVDLNINPKGKRITLKITSNDGTVLSRTVPHSEPLHLIYESKEDYLDKKETSTSERH